jgi:MFS family permease
MGSNSSDNKDDLNKTDSDPKAGQMALTDVSEPVDPKQAQKTKYSDIFTILAAGSALISDGYQNNTQTMLNTLFAKRYGSSVYTSPISTRISNSLTVGCILGQIGVGLICDRIGRKSAIVLSTILLTMGAIFATAASPVNGNVSNLWWWLTVARGATGVGVGGEYPSSSTSASEAANERYGQKKRSTVFILCTNLVLSLGGPLAVSFFLVVLSASGYNNTTSQSDARNLDIVWRICYGFGALLPLIVFYFRWRIVNSKLFRAGAIRRNVPYWLALKRYWPRLLGTSFCWFLYDWVAFSNGAFSATVISTVIHNPTLKRTGEYQLLLGAIALPGAILGAFLVRWLGSKYQLVFGFVGYIIVCLIVGLAWDHMIRIPALFVIFYGLLASVGNAGPGSILGLVSSESFPTALRGTAYGISAAVGKVGAVVGTEVFKPVQTLGKKYIFIVAACVGVVGAATAFFLIPDTAKFNLAEEDEKWRQYLLANGWDGYMGDGTTATHKASDIKAEDYGNSSSSDHDATNVRC